LPDKKYVKNTFRKYKLQISFFIVFTILFFLLGYNNLLSTGPMSIHAWRQSDSYSFALTYFHENNKLLEPSILFVGENGHGRAVSEFPVLYYITAKIWQITGVTPAILKFINFILLLTGLFHLALLSKKILKDNFWSMFVVLFLFSSPIIGYYGFNFIPNIPAFGLALTGLYYLFEFTTTENTKKLVYFTLIFIFAALIKVTSLLSLLGAVFVVLTYYLTDFKTKKVALLKLSFATIVIFFSYWRWYIFSTTYNKNNLNGIFNQSTIPIWNVDKVRIIEIMDKFYFNVFPQYFNEIAFYVLLLSLAVILVLRKSINPFARRASLIYFLALVSFLLLFFEGIDVHDYFLTNTLIFIPAVVVTLLMSFNKLSPTLFKSFKIKMVGVIILVLVLNHNMITTRSHYNPHNKLVAYNLPLKKRASDFWRYNHHMLLHFDNQYNGINKYMKKIGLTYNDKVISVGDQSPNKTLSLMELGGFTEYHYQRNFDEERKIKKMIELGATCIAINSNDDAGEITKSFLGNKLGQFNDISIYSIKEQ